MKNIIKLPEISIIICCFNHQRWIERCIRSIYLQKNIKLSEFEIIVVDDKSKDYSRKIINKLNFPNLKFIKNKKNIGLPNSINKAIKVTKGRYVVRIDSDDYVSRDFLYISRLFLNFNREYQAVAVDYMKVDEFEKNIGKVNCMKDQIACGITFRKECLIDIGLYNPKFKMREGHELRRRFEKKFSIGRINLPLYKYRIHSKNRTKNKKILRKYDSKLKKKP